MNKKFDNHSQDKDQIYKKRTRTGHRDKAIVYLICFILVANIATNNQALESLNLPANIFGTVLACLYILGWVLFAMFIKNVIHWLGKHKNGPNESTKNTRSGLPMSIQASSESVKHSPSSSELNLTPELPSLNNKNSSKFKFIVIYLAIALVLTYLGFKQYTVYSCQNNIDQIRNEVTEKYVQSTGMQPRFSTSDELYLEREFTKCMRNKGFN
jgi:hypothetical protein